MYTLAIMSKSFDAIVLGVGSMGAPACYYLASRGYKVLGLEQFDIPHDQGSHAGQSRIIRKAYFEHSDYVPLLERAYANWKQLEQATGTQLYYPTGLLYAGTSDGLLLKGVKESAARFNLAVEHVSNSNERFPQFNLPDSYEVVFEPDAGFITPERAIVTYAEQALVAGAELHTKEPVLEWKPEGSGIQVKTTRGVYTSQSLVITAGPWASNFIPALASKLKVTRQVIGWVNPKQRAPFQLGNFPCWMVDDAQPGMFYGFPILPVGKFGGPIGLKVAHHYPGTPVNPDQVNRSVSAAEEELLVNAIKRILPQGYGSTHTLKTCLYTNTPDEDFIIDYLPGYDHRVAIAAGFSGHGFKFSSAVGEVLADLATGKTIDLPLGFLGIKRFMTSH